MYTSKESLGFALRPHEIIERTTVTNLLGFYKTLRVYRMLSIDEKRQIEQAALMACNLKEFKLYKAGIMKSLLSYCSDEEIEKIYEFEGNPFSFVLID